MRNKTLVLLACASLAACAESQRVAPIATTDPGTLQAMYQDIYGLAQDRSCIDPSACASLPLGSKPCGGPWTYLVYSKERVAEVELLAKVTQLGVYEGEYNREYRVLSTCDLAQPANPGCVNGVCVDLGQSQ